MSRKKTKILIVGAGKGGSLLIDMFHKSGMAKILGVVDRNTDAPGIKLAKKLKIPTSSDFKKFINKKELEEIINVTGREKVQKELLRLKPPRVEVIGGYSAKFMWGLIEERKKTETKIHKSEEKLRNIVEHSNELFYVHDTRHKLTYASPQAKDILGYSPDEMLTEWTNLITENPINEIAIQLTEKALKTGKRQKSYFLELYRKDKSKVFLEIDESPLKDSMGKVVGIVGAARDITEHKHAEEALRDSEYKFRSLFDLSPQAIALSDVKTGRLIDVNEKFCELTRYTKKEILGRTTTECGFYSHQDRNRFTKILKAQGKVQGLEMDFKVKDNSIINTLMFARFIQLRDNPLILTIFFDMTYLKQAEETILESEEKFRAISSTAVDAILVMDNEGKISYWNPSAERMFGYTSDEALGKELHSFLAPSRYHEAYKKGMARFKKTGKGPAIGNTSEFFAIMKDGTEFPIEVSTSAIQIKGLWHSVGIVRDITDRKRAEHALRESEKKYRALFEESKDVVYISTPDGKFLDINPAGVELFGYPSKENLLQIDISKDLYVYPSEREEFQKLLATEGFVKDYELMFKRKDDQHLTVLITATAVGDEKGAITAYRGIMKDITERKRLEQQLTQAQKMEAIGQLAGGIAHDFNNILTAIIGFGTLLKMETDEDDPRQSYVNQILSSSERAANLTQALLAFSRKQIISPKPLDLNEIIKGVKNLLSRIIGEDIELSTILTDKDLTIMADSGQIEQVLMNLATNARDAMPDGGNLSITTDLLSLDKDFTKAHGFKRPGLYAAISFEDTGMGMDDKIKTRIFEPFFTTKEVGKGTGLGLSMVYGIIQQHDGYINVYSEVGRGTVFKIYLPLIKSARDEKHEEIPPTIKKGTETVLVAEDDTQVRALIKEVLAGFGYTILEAEDGDDALKVFSEHTDKIQLVILDVIMPKLNGKEIYEEMQKIRPDIKALFTSGYDANIIHKKGILEETLPFISKPISPEDLLKKVREILDSE
jgi:two-component system cell cycle sensor histidine kinase/response regulator CckA